MSAPRVDRRRFLHAASWTLALPALASLPGAAPPPRDDARERPKRLVCIGTQLGFYKREFFAERDDPQLLRPLREGGLDGRFTTLSGLDHKGPTGRAHQLVHTLYTGTLAPSVSLDQLVAPRLGADTRHESLQVCAGQPEAQPALSFSPSGVPLPPVRHPSLLFAQVFGAGNLAAAHHRYLLDSGRSLLDELHGDTRALRGGLAADDARKLDEYLESLRTMERRLARSREWAERPFPEPPDGLRASPAESVHGSRLLQTEALMWDLLALAIRHDAARVISFTIPNTSQALWIDGVPTSRGYHNLSHHGKRRDKIKDLLRIEHEHMRGFARFLCTLDGTPDPLGSGSLLDGTVVLLGSAMGDAAAHRRTNFPLLVAGGGLRHRRHVSCGGDDAPNEMACDLFVTVLRRLGFPVERFGSSTGDLDAVLT